MPPCSLRPGLNIVTALQIKEDDVSGLTYAAGALLTLHVSGLMHRCEYGKQCQELNKLASHSSYGKLTLATESDEYVIAGANYDLVRRHP